MIIIKNNYQGFPPPKILLKIIFERRSPLKARMKARIHTRGGVLHFGRSTWAVDRDRSWIHEPVTGSIHSLSGRWLSFVALGPAWNRAWGTANLLSRWTCNHARISNEKPALLHLRARNWNRLVNLGREKVG